jgi:hypothetical protein
MVKSWGRLQQIKADSICSNYKVRLYCHLCVIHHVRHITHFKQIDVYSDSCSFLLLCTFTFWKLNFKLSPLSPSGSSAQSFSLSSPFCLRCCEQLYSMVPTLNNCFWIRTLFTITNPNIGHGLYGQASIPSKGRDFFLFTIASRPALGPTQHPIQSLPGLFPWG